jgi:hypothetical protein
MQFLPFGFSDQHEAYVSHLPGVSGQFRFHHDFKNTLRWAEITYNPHQLGARFFSLLHCVCMYVCMYNGWARIRPLHRDLQWSIVLPLWLTLY